MIHAQVIYKKNYSWCSLRKMVELPNRGLAQSLPARSELVNSLLTRSLREPGGPCTKSMEASESCMERVNHVSKGWAELTTVLHEI